MAEPVQKLEDDLKKLMQIAKNAGLSDADIDECIADVLSDPTATATNVSTSNLWSRFLFRGVGLAFKAFLAFGVLVVTLSVLSSYAPASMNSALQHVIEPYYYPTQRLMRMVTLPLHNYFNLSAFYSSGCFINNPFYDENSTMEMSQYDPDCKACNDLARPIQLKNSKDHPGQGAFHEASLVVYLSYVEDAPASEIWKFYESKGGNIQVMVDGQEYSNLIDVVNLGLPFEEQAELRAHWQSPIEQLRTLVEPPSFIPVGSNFHDLITFYTLGPLGRQYSLKDYGSVMRSVTQVSGTTDVVLEPLHLKCQASCGTHRIILNPGHSVTYMPTVWRALLKGNNSEELSISYTTDFDYVLPEISDSPIDRPPTDSPQADSPQNDSPQGDSPQADSPQADSLQADSPQTDIPQGDSPQGDSP